MREFYVAGAVRHECDFFGQGTYPEVASRPNLLLLATMDTTELKPIKACLEWGVAATELPFSEIDFGALQDEEERKRAIDELAENAVVIASAIGCRAAALSGVSRLVAKPAKLFDHPHKEGSLCANLAAVPVAPRVMPTDLTQFQPIQPEGPQRLVNCLQDDMQILLPNGQRVAVPRASNIRPFEVESEYIELGQSHERILIAAERPRYIKGLPELVPDDTLLLVHSEVPKIAAEVGVPAELIQRMVIGTGVERSPDNKPLCIIKGLARIGLTTLGQHDDKQILTDFIK